MAADRPIPERLGKYELRGVLGKGAMGVVYDAWDPGIQRRVAVKTIRLPDAGDETAEEEYGRFKREAQAAGRLSHPGIVGVYDSGEADGIAYIAMELVEGQSLKALMDAQHRLTPQDAVRVMKELLDALAYSHARGVIHRDIKPTNILVTPQGQLKITDFGIARIESSSMTQMGTVMGTPAYMSPEQFMGQTVDQRTDIYAAGVLLFQLLTGERPFEGGLTAIMHKVLHTTPPKPSELSVTAPEAFDAVVAKAMARRPEDRYPSAEAFSAALTEALAGGPAQKAEPAWDSDATMVAPVRREAPAAAPVPPRPQPVAAKPPAPPAAKRPPVAALAGAAAAVLVVLGGLGYWLTRPSGDAGSTTVASTAPSQPPGSTVAAPSATPAPAATAPPPQVSTASNAAPAPSAPPRPSPAAPAPSPVSAAPASAPALSIPPTPSIPSTPSPRPVLAPSTPAPPVSTAPINIPAPSVPQASSLPPAPAPSTPALAPVTAAPANTAPSVPPIPSASVAPPAMTQPVQPAPVLSPAPAAPPPAPQPSTSQTVVASIMPPALPPSLTPPVAPASQPSSAPAATESTPPPQPASETAAQGQQAAVATVACTLLDVAGAPDNRTAVTGLVGAGSPEGAARAALAAAGGRPTGMTWNATRFDGPYCSVVDTLRAIRSKDAPGFELGLRGGRTRLRNGETMAPAIRAPSFPAYMQIAYFQSNRRVVHLVPAPGEPDKAVGPGAAVPVGDPRTGGWAVGDPFGADMMVVIMSSSPLPARSEDEEPTDVYLAALERAGQQIVRDGGIVAVRAVPIQTFK